MSLVYCREHDWIYDNAGCPHCLEARSLARLEALAPPTALVEPREPEPQVDHGRLVKQCLDISVQLADAGIEACPLPEGVRRLIAQRDSAVADQAKAPASPAVVERAPLGAQLIAAERERQIMKEGWTDSHDDEHDGAEMAAAACCYGAIARRQADGTIRSRAENIGAPSGWPWEQAWWKPSDDPIRNLVKAGALIAAEIDRLNRLLAWPSSREREK